jgi:hypothetical protein
MHAGEPRIGPPTSAPAPTAVSVTDTLLSGVSQLDVGGLQVAMHDACFVRGFERRCNLRRNTQRLGNRQRTARDALRERLAFHQFENQRMAIGNSHDFEQCADIGMIQ